MPDRNRSNVRFYFRQQFLVSIAINVLGAGHEPRPLRLAARAPLFVSADQGKPCTTRVRRIFLDANRQEAVACRNICGLWDEPPR